MTKMSGINSSSIPLKIFLYLIFIKFQQNKTNKNYYLKCFIWIHSVVILSLFFQQSSHFCKDMLQPSFELEMHLLKGHFKDLVIVENKIERRERRRETTQYPAGFEPTASRDFALEARARLLCYNSCPWLKLTKLESKENNLKVDINPLTFFIDFTNHAPYSSLSYHWRGLDFSYLLWDSNSRQFCCTSSRDHKWRLLTDEAT